MLVQTAADTRPDGDTGAEGPKVPQPTAEAPPTVPVIGPSPSAVHFRHVQWFVISIPYFSEFNI